MVLAYLEEHKDKLCKTCLERMERNPLRVIDCKEEGCKQIVANAPKTIDYLDEECRTHFEQLQSLLESLGIPYQIDTGIVRGLDYYTKTVFEFVNKDGFTLCGGGRYDNLVHEIDGKQDIPAAGFGMGLERILYFLELEGVELGGVNPPDLYLGFMGGVKARAFQIIDALRKQGISVETDYLDRSIKAQMKYANKINAPYVVILGEDEIASGKVKVKNMADGSEVETSVDNIAAVIQK